MLFCQKNNSGNFIYNSIEITFIKQCYCVFVTNGDSLNFKGKVLSLDRLMLLSAKIQFLNEKLAVLQKGAMEGRWN